MSRSNSKGRFKKIIQWFHLWLGLISGLVFFIMGLTGAIYAFQPELSKLTQPYLTVKEERGPYLPVSALSAIAAKQLPGKKPTRIIYYAKDRAVTVHFIKRGDQPYYWAVFLNPYSGAVLKARDMDTEFFRFILRGHMYLWLPQKIGQTVVATCMIIFAVIVISGLILWWPRNKNARKSSFKVKWRASPKRLNYDLHKILGFYASWVLLFSITTGLAWSFESVMKAEYWLFSGGKERPAPPKFISRNERDANAAPVIDKALNSATQNYPGIEHYQVRLPDSDSAAIQIIMYLKEGIYAPADNLYFNQYTGARFNTKNWGLYASANAGEKANRMTYDIHTGGIGGLAGRTLVFFAGLIAASLPVTGFYIWWGKKRKKKRASLKLPAAKKKEEVLV
ncbi:PepSY domain-containing protein [Niabella pedocola]|uniref:PepSY domain-containing protein n=1 Tax=Niabella pedocola TaxID=1752077 RepID=A0ABS8PXN2_9BACT|nr:PepSY-associated TM helix domain-containing protein [Niabella pedocola]MCD2425818.1 PepSY domain-containing protein [Niabella pedocola]